jgi:hypothetical protein
MSSASNASHTCYFSLLIPTTSPSHFSVESPSTSPLSTYTSDTFSDLTNPLLASRPPPFDTNMPSQSGNVSSLLQLQTAAAYRPAAQPLQHSSSTSSNSSSSSKSSSSDNSTSETPLCCARCRRTAYGFSGMVKLGVNLFYCNHCASMTGYGAS